MAKFNTTTSTRTVNNEGHAYSMQPKTKLITSDGLPNNLWRTKTRGHGKGHVKLSKLPNEKQKG